MKAVASFKNGGIHLILGEARIKDSGLYTQMAELLKERRKGEMLFTAHDWFSGGKD